AGKSVAPGEWIAHLPFPVKPDSAAQNPRRCSGLYLRHRLFHNKLARGGDAACPRGPCGGNAAWMLQPLPEGDTVSPPPLRRTVCVLDTSDLYSYGGVFAALVAAGVGFPMPEEVPIVTAGALAGHAWQDPGSSIRWWVFLPLCILGVVISDGLLYLVGRTFGLRVLTFPFVARILPRERLERIQANFQKHGVLILLFARILPGIRSPIFLTAGIMKLSWKRFLLADGIYALPGVSLLFFLAFWFTDQFRDLVTK